jgi:hypothetical protein
MECPRTTRLVGVRITDEESTMLDAIATSLQTPRLSRVTRSDAIRVAIRETADLFTREHEAVGGSV